MWVIFLLSALSVALAMMVIVWAANKVWISMRKDEDEYQNSKIKKEEKEI